MSHLESSVYKDTWILLSFNFCAFKKGKAIPVTGRGGP
jgi:hypothetical protein